MSDKPASTLAGSRPNILFVLADDLSYRDLSCFGQIQFGTPNLDQLCADGLRFDEAYSGSPECAPSRGSLITGMHMGHCRIRKNQSARGQDHLEASDVTIAEVLRDNGYRTGMFGKWGIGLPDTEGTPDKKGFDFSYGFYDQRRAHTYYPNYLYENGIPIPIPENYGYDMDESYRHTKTPGGLHEYDSEGHLVPHGVKDPKVTKNSEDLCYGKALGFIDNNHQQPFFLYYATQLPHGPCIIPDLGEFKDKPWPLKNREWAAMVTHLDRHVGGLLSRLEEHDVLDNTLVIFASDNGYSHWGYMGRKPYADDPILRNKGPWKGGKFISWDGGARVPMFVSWPGRVQKGVSRHLVSLYDIFATACELAGAKEIPQTDGISFVSLLEGREGAQESHDFLYWENGGHATRAQAARMGKWFGWRKTPDHPIQLWDTDTDVESKYDVADNHPGVVQQILEIFNREHVDSEWYLNPAETDEEFKAKQQKAEREGCIQNAVVANTEYRGQDETEGNPDDSAVEPDPNIPD